jgi:GNAT superfamily N-acetyltransferase
LQSSYYSQEQIDAALRSVYGVDSQLIDDGTYFAVEWLTEPSIDEQGGSNVQYSDGATSPGTAVAVAADVPAPAVILVGCGGWSRHRKLYGSDRFKPRGFSGDSAAADPQHTNGDLLDPSIDPAKIRAFYVHPDYARRGVGSALLSVCEFAAAEAGFRRCEMGSTLSGVPFYEARGYTRLLNWQDAAPAADGLKVEIVRMGKDLVK